MHTSHVSIQEWGRQARQDETRMKRKTDKNRAIRAGLEDYDDGLYLDTEVQADLCASRGEECHCPAR